MKRLLLLPMFIALSLGCDSAPKSTDREATTMDNFRQRESYSGTSKGWTLTATPNGTLTEPAFPIDLLLVSTHADRPEERVAVTLEVSVRRSATRETVRERGHETVLVKQPERKEWRAVVSDVLGIGPGQRPASSMEDGDYQYYIKCQSNEFDIEIGPIPIKLSGYACGTR